VKKLLALLLLTPLVAGASVAEYCMEKYPPEKSKDKFVQCIEDGMEFKRNSETIAKPDTNSYSTSSHHKYDFLAPDVRNKYTKEQQKQLDNMYLEFTQSETNKAFAVELNPQTSGFSDVYAWCANQQTIAEAKKCAINKCASSKNKNNICAIQYTNYSYVLEDSLTVLSNWRAKNNNTSNNRNTFDWNRAAKAAADVFNNNPAFGGTPPTKICNFKNFNGQIISGDCSKFSITIGNDTYRKVK
jgi:hypothetical protein